jgi:hypothetical protein
MAAYGHQPYISFNNIQKKKKKIAIHTDNILCEQQNHFMITKPYEKNISLTHNTHRCR